jgi:hypothetical protein
MRTNKLTAAVLISDAALGTRLAACGGSSGSQTYRATGGTLSGGAVIVGQRHRGGRLDRRGRTLTFPDVTVRSNGSYPVTIGYANVTGDRQAVIAVNNGESGRWVTLPGERGGPGSVTRSPRRCCRCTQGLTRSRSAIRPPTRPTSRDHCVERLRGNQS